MNRRAAAAKGGTIEDAESSQMGAKTIFAGLGVGFLYQVLMGAFKGWKDTPEKVFGAPFKAGSISAEISPALLGVGYIIGPRIASIMCAGGVLAYLVLIPAIKFFGEGMPAPWRPEQFRSARWDPVKFAVRTSCTSAPARWPPAALSVCSARCQRSGMDLKGGLADLRGGQGAAANAPRTDQDLSMKFVIGGIFALIALIMIFPATESALEHSRRDLDRCFWFPVCNCFVAIDW